MCKLSCLINFTHNDQKLKKKSWITYLHFFYIFFYYIHIIVASRGYSGTRGVILRARFWTSHYANSALTLIVFVIPTIKNVDKRRKLWGKSEWVCGGICIWKSEAFLFSHLWWICSSLLVCIKNIKRVSPHHFSQKKKWKKEKHYKKHTHYKITYGRFFSKMNEEIFF